eukprot:CAMPEP_0198591712 /NCGR_PEP_ID=MMETSP1462-20131121/137233_1 /TAXON_ID=1333877 /ORGANISM="Brandtodinium nutriculum, Strain RCC3387" /LENGTH=89 /DNA_ID=CAMNT_0044323279 /DNA_START=29 /DNA_END=298 /DNA_ORIENTATION=+
MIAVPPARLLEFAPQSWEGMTRQGAICNKSEPTGPGRASNHAAHRMSSIAELTRARHVGRASRVTGGDAQRLNSNGMRVTVHIPPLAAR